MREYPGGIDEIEQRQLRDLAPPRMELSQHGQAGGWDSEPSAPSKWQTRETLEVTQRAAVSGSIAVGLCGFRQPNGVLFD
jgi:hypothetical protein